MNWFTRGGAGYAAHRPDYPDALADALAAVAPARRLAVDVGCGTGQLTRLLAPRFDTVIGVDPSADQIAHATGADNIEYRKAPAEDSGLPDGVADLITVAQAAHWFDLPAFYAEARRVAAPGAVLTLITYGVVELDDDLQPVFDDFYRNGIGRYWPPQRRHVENGYADLPFPFPRVALPATVIERDWTFDEFLGYLSTWSAVASAARSGQEQPLGAFAAELGGLWGEPGCRRRVRWPITVVAGRVRPREPRVDG